MMPVHFSLPAKEQRYGYWRALVGSLYGLLFSRQRVDGRFDRRLSTRVPVKSRASKRDAPRQPGTTPSWWLARVVRGKRAGD
jgi:hypothetical protein